MYHIKYIIETFINYEHFSIHTVPKITIVTEKNGQTKYKLNLPKESMENLAVKKGDRLTLISTVADQLTFKLERC